LDWQVQEYDAREQSHEMKQPVGKKKRRKDLEKQHEREAR
jgi:hypothetical protein